MRLRFRLSAFLVVPLVAVFASLAPVALAPAAGAATESCATPVTSAPAGPATVSAASTVYGQVLVVGSGPTWGADQVSRKAAMG
jgi:hypothetical protein